MRRLDSKKKRKQFRLWLSPEEKSLAKAKMEQYGYKTLSGYIRDAAIYESLVEININGLDEMKESFDNFVSETKKYTKEVRRILKYDTSISEKEKERLQYSLYQIYNELKKVQKEVNQNINYEIIEKIGKQKLEEMQDGIYKKDCTP